MEHKSVGRIHPASAEGGCRDLGKILIAAAVRQELAAFRPSNGNVLQVITGMGVRAGDSVRKVFRREPVSLVVSAGFAGAALPGLRVGDLVMASEVVEESSGRVLRPSVLPDGMREVARFGTLVTVPDLLADPSAKSQRGSRFHAVAVEMETAAVALAAEEAGVRWLALRVILDPMEAPVAAGSVRQAVGLAVRPWRWAELARFLGCIRKARESLARGLELLVQQVDLHN